MVEPEVSTHPAADGILASAVLLSAREKHKILDRSRKGQSPQISRLLAIEIRDMKESVVSTYPAADGLSETRVRLQTGLKDYGGVHRWDKGLDVRLHTYGRAGIKYLSNS